MLEPTIRPTITHRVRDFLNRQDIELHPWSGLNDTYAQLYSLLNQRKDDAAFWPHLSKLLQEVIADTVDPARAGRLAAPQAELLKSWDIDELIRDLRAALPGGITSRNPSRLKSFLSS